MDSTVFHSMIQWLHSHPEWGSFLIFLFSFLESFALVGLIFPGTVIMTGAGILIGSGILPFKPIYFYAALGSFVGDYLSYGLGYYYRDNLKSIWPFKRYLNVIAKGEAFFNKHGGKSVFIGRFIGPIRPLIPLIAGSLKMPVLRFLIVDISASLLWAFAYLLPGFIIGAASLALPHDAAKRILIDLGLLIVLACIIYWTLKFSLVKITVFLDRAIQRFWLFLGRHPHGRFFYNLLKISHIPDDHSQLGIAIFALIFWIFFFVLVISVMTHSGLYHIDQPLHHFFRSAYSLTIEKVMLLITYVGTPSNMGILWVIVLAWLCLRRYWFTAIHWALVGFMAAGMAEVFKLLVASPRPLGLQITPDGYSFPSGHTTMSTALFSFLAIIIAQDRDEYFGWFCYCTAALFCVLVGLSRVYLGAHWVTDVLAGLALGLACSLSVAISYRRYRSKQKHIIELVLIVFLSLSVLWAHSYFHSFKKNIEAFKPVWSNMTITENSWWQSGISHEPLYRKNRLGKNIQTLNIQWLGSLNQISAILSQQGWQLNSKSVLLHTISYFGEKNPAQTLPLFSALYQDQKPQLLMSTLVPANGSLLVLRLWKSHVNIINQNTGATTLLWVGEVSYLYPDKFRVFKNKKTIASLQPKTPFALDVLTNALTATPGTQWKIIQLPDVPRLLTFEDTGWDGRVLLIRNITY